jgi:hypothetical protein
MTAKKKSRPLKPRNLLARDPLLAKGGPHERRDKRAKRARLKALARRLEQLE